MKQKALLILYFMLLPLYFYTQTMDNNDSLCKKLDFEINFSKFISSDIIWERINIPINFGLNSFFINENYTLYIGSNGLGDNGGVYQSNDYGITWNSTGLLNGQIHFIGQNNNHDLVVGRYSRIYVYEDNIWSEVYHSTTGGCNSYFGIDSLLFVGNGGVIKSDNDGSNWELVYDFPGSAEQANAFTATTPDSVFMGTTKFTGNGGGVYLSIDGGDNWNYLGLHEHFIADMSVDNSNQVYAGNNGHYETGQGGLYRYVYNTEIWDTLFYYPWVQTIVFNRENHIFIGYKLSNMTDIGGVMHSEDNGETWIVDTVGMGSTWVTDLQIDNNGFLYALTGYSSKKLYRTALPIGISEKPQHKNHFSHCYPNPANSYINITFKPLTQNTNELYLKIYSIVGNVLIEKKLSAPEIEKGIISLDISNLKTGCYVYRFSGYNFYSINKFTKQ